MSDLIFPDKSQLTDRAAFPKLAFEAWGCFDVSGRVVRTNHQGTSAKAIAAWSPLARRTVESGVFCASHASAKAAPAVEEFLNPSHAGSVSLPLGGH